jgi:hypothetical protein
MTGLAIRLRDCPVEGWRSVQSYLLDQWNEVKRTRTWRRTGDFMYPFGALGLRELGFAIQQPIRALTPADAGDVNLYKNKKRIGNERQKKMWRLRTSSTT